MPKTRRPNLTIEEKIEKAQRSVELAKERYDNAVEKLELLMEEKKKLDDEKLLAVIHKSKKSYDDIIKFLNEQ